MPYRHLIRPFFSDWRLVCFVFALGLYALWGSPTPNNPDWVEGTIALLLFLAIGWQRIVQNFLFYKDQKVERWELSGKILLLYGFTLSLIVAILQGNELGIIIRDLIAFLFLCLPLFFVMFLKERQQRKKAFTILCFIIGLVFSVRVLVPHFLFFRQTTELLYLANSPFVLMSALFLGGFAGYQIYQRATTKHFIRGCVFIALCSLPLMAMFVDLQRASFAALVVSAASLFLIGFVKAPLKMILPVLFMGLGIFVFADYFSELVEGVGAKTSQVGLNMRAQEFQAVWKEVSETPFTLMFGRGGGLTLRLLL